MAVFLCSEENWSASIAKRDTTHTRIGIENIFYKSAIGCGEHHWLLLFAAIVAVYKTSTDKLVISTSVKRQLVLAKVTFTPRTSL